ncbi:MAG: potassium transporter [Desulfosarcina sp.]|nr:potassium transporter [Desulfobacterales bacterium]
MTSFWIIGGGKFGIKSAEAAIKRYPGADITVIDKNSEVCRRVLNLSFNSVCMEGIKYLTDNLKRNDVPDWIIPVIPVHVAYEWIRIQLSEEYSVVPVYIPEELAATLPNPLRGKDGALYISFADFICPDNCPEPAKICTYTGKPRLGILHEKLASIRYNGFCSVVVQSRQLSPGVGGYTPEDLYAALEKIKHADTPCLLSTACRCHGVMNAFTITTP